MCISLSFCLVSIRSSWRVRRTRSRGKQSGSGGRPGSGHDTEKSSVHEVQYPNERLHQPNLYTIPERARSQKGRGREPPVVIGDPTDTNVLAKESRRRASSHTSIRQIEDATSISSRYSTRRSSHSSADIPSRNPLDLRIIPTIPQEDSEDVFFPMPTSPHYLQLSSPPRSRSHPHTPTHLPARTMFQTI